MTGGIDGCVRARNDGTQAGLPAVGAAYLDCACSVSPAMALAQCAASMCAAAEKRGWSRVIAPMGTACWGLVLVLVLVLVATLLLSAGRARFWNGAASLLFSDE